VKERLSRRGVPPRRRRRSQRRRAATRRRRRHILGLAPPPPITARRRGLYRTKKMLPLSLFGQFKKWLFEGVVLHQERVGGWDGVENHT